MYPKNNFIRLSGILLTVIAVSLVFNALLSAQVQIQASASKSLAQPTGKRVVVLNITGNTLATRPELYGHNMTANDWHGTLNNNRPPILWDTAANRPDPAWTPLTHAWPLRVMRYHSGNFYPWRDAFGPVSERKIIKDEYRRTLRPDAGLQEFLRWLETLPDPRPEPILIASPFRPVQELADLVAYCNATTGPMADLRAAHGHPAPYNVRYWELGNETDWINRDDLDVTRAETEREKKSKLLPAEYIARCRERIHAMRAIDPTIKLLAHAQTAPWPSTNPHWRDWHREVIRDLGDTIDAITIHPYYDGHSVPYVLASIDALIADIRELQPSRRNITVAVTEHSRWVNYKNLDERPQSWGLQGAISAGDFLLRAMARPEISSANYWCYLHRGPWRVLNADWDQGTTHKFGTGAFMLYQLLNDSLLPRYELLTPEPPGASRARSNAYPYQVTTAHFSDVATGAHALVAVNRSATEPVILLIENIPPPASGKLTFSLVTGNSLQSTNVPATPDAVTLQTRAIDARSDAPLRLELPPRCVASWRW
ncbi:alpha-L-arabinofuranosidase [Opitutaceae bacterium TAV5]|nr:alpha-L-arabinofuranosidase [Opitutaceae bacterium TAV5]